MTSTDLLQVRVVGLRSEASDIDALASETALALGKTPAGGLEEKLMLHFSGRSSALRAEASALESGALLGGTGHSAESVACLSKSLAHAQRESVRRKGALGQYWGNVALGCKWGIDVLLKAMGGAQ